MQIVTIVLFFGLTLQIEGLKYTRCGLANALLKHSSGIFKKSDLPDWVCLVEHESSRDTNKVGRPNKNGSIDYGLFQINSKYWCGLSGPSGDCNIACNSLVGNNGLDASANCVTKIYKRHGFKAWYGWLNGCKGKRLPDLATECKI